MPDDGVEGDRPGAAPGWHADAAVAAPVKLPAPAPAMGWQLYGVKANLGLAIAVCVLLGIDVALNALEAIARWRAATSADDLLGRVEDAEARPVTAEDLDAVNSAVAFTDTATGLTNVALVATGVVTIIWFYRARANIDLLGLHHPRLTKGWAIGGWFCPIVGCWFPVQIANDIWKGSDSRGRRERLPLLIGWWLLFVLGYGLYVLANGDDESEVTLDDTLATLQDNSYVGMVASVVSIVAAVLFLIYVLRVTTMQRERQQELLAWSGPMGMWPPLQVWPGRPVQPWPAQPWPGQPAPAGAGSGNVPLPPVNPAAAQAVEETAGS